MRSAAGTRLKGLFALVILAAVTACVFPHRLDAQEAWAEFSHREQKWSLRYPANWEREDGQPVGSMFFIAPPNERGQRINVLVGNPEPVSEGMTPEQFSDVQSAELRSVFQSYTAVRTETAVVAGRAAVVHHYTYNLVTLRVYQVRVVLVAGTTAYFLLSTTMADSPTLQQDVVLLLRIMSTFSVSG